MLKRGVLVLTPILALGLIVSVLVTPASGVASPDAQPCANVVDAKGNRTWQGEPTPELEEVGNDLQDIADTHPEAISGVSFCSDFSGVEIYVKGGDRRVDARISRVTKRNPTVLVHRRTAENSLNDLLVAQEEVREEAKGDSEHAVAGIGPDIENDGLVVTVDATPEDERELVDPTSRQAERLRTRLNPRVPVRFRAARDSEHSVTRLADAPPWTMSARIYSNSGGRCSLGVRIRLYKGGPKKALTAGHCRGTLFSNNNRIVGRQYTTTYPGNAIKYGDWKILDGSTYRMKVFTSGSLGAHKTMKVVGGSYGGRPNGSGICTSGGTTAQVCRYRVIGSYRIEDIEGVGQSHMLEMHHDTHWNGNSDQGGFKKGDSGGPCYFASGDGVRVVGVVTGRIQWPWTIGSSYYCTQLSGVRAWAPNMRVG